MADDDERIPRSLIVLGVVVAVLVAAVLAIGAVGMFGAGSSDDSGLPAGRSSTSFRGVTTLRDLVGGHSAAAVDSPT